MLHCALKKVSVLALEKVVFSIEEVCELLGSSRSSICRAINSGLLETFTFGTRRMISARALNEFIAKLEDASRDSREARKEKNR